MKYVSALLTITLCTLSANLFCAQGPMTLKVKTMKTELMIPFTPQTTIEAIKQRIQTDEGIPVEQQRLTKSEGWAFGFPIKQIVIELTNNQTCSGCDLRDNQKVNLGLKLSNRAQIEAELKARKKAITEALLHQPFPPPLVVIVAGYDTVNED